MSPPPPLRQRLRTALDQARKARDLTAVAALRSTLGSIDNAEAVDPASAPAASSEVVAGAVDGLGATEATRRSLSEADITSIVEAEIAERLDAAATYDGAGRPDRAGALRAETAVLTAVLQHSDARR